MILTKRPILVLVFLCTILLMFADTGYQVRILGNNEEFPNDWFYNQRAYPQGEINYDVYKQAVQNAAVLKKQAAAGNNFWVLAGPTNVGGRLSDVELSPTSYDTIYAGAASGGVLKSVDRGQTWTSIFDDALSLSIGDIALDPTDPNTIYVGTGEVNCGGGSMTYDGFGAYKSTDGGDNWTYLGLEDTRYISRIVVDPSNPQRVYLGAMGKLFAYNEGRGVYRSTDGGKNWDNILYISDRTGCVDLVIDPATPTTLYAAMWERLRTPESRLYGGGGSGLYKSTNGGDSWVELTNGLPHNADDIGRIGISLCASQPSILYSLFIDASGDDLGVYKSTDSGDSWSKCNNGYNSSSYGWWFGNIRVDPNDPDVVYYLELYLYKTIDGGQSWSYVSGGVHVDQHGMYIHPLNSDFVVLGNDGGLYITTNGSSSWTKSYNMPVTQFYTCEIDYQHPERLYGGTQDNGTKGTTTGGIDDWSSFYGGDGFYVLVDPTDNRYMYAESQRGGLGRSTNGGSSFTSARNGISSSDRKNWSSPLVLDPSNPRTLYFGANRVYKSTNRAVSWTAISPDLTNGAAGDYTAFGTTTTLDVSPLDGNVIYAGTDDGNVHVTLNGGSNWTLISNDLPVRWITRVTADLFDSETAYVTISGYRQDEYLPHIFRTTDAGASWEDISGDLPETPLNDVVVDASFDSILYVASDVGVYMTRNLGSNWEYLGAGLPNVPVTDLKLHNPTRTLIAATFGRSMYTFDLSQVTAIENDDPVQKPADFELLQNYPNPFNPSTTIKYSLKEASKVSIRVFNISGREVAALVDSQLPAGRYEVQWDGRNGAGIPVSGGLYIYRIVAGKYVQSRKMILLR